MLKHKPYFSVLGTLFCIILSVKNDASFIRCLEACNNSQKCCFARTGRSQQGNQFPVLMCRLILLRALNESKVFDTLRISILITNQSPQIYHNVRSPYILLCCCIFQWATFFTIKFIKAMRVSSDATANAAENLYSLYNIQHEEEPYW